MDVVLVNPPNLFKGNEPFAPEHRCGPDRRYGLTMPLGLLYIMSTLEREGISVRLVDALAPPRKLSDIAKEVCRDMPKLVGISATSLQTRGAVQIAQKIKKELGGACKIALGGAHITSDPDFISKFPIFDLGVTGYGELTLLALAKRILKQEEVRGIHHGMLPDDLDTLPFPSRHVLDLKQYSDEVNLVSTRGCPMKCIFCSVGGRKPKHRSPGNTVEEIEEVVNCHGFRHFRFVDDVFTIDKKHTVALCRKIIDKKLDVFWKVSTRADLVDEELLNLMRKAGCTEVSFGVESGSERIRNLIVKKGIKNEAIFKAVSLCKKVGIKAGINLMLGFPNETSGDINETVKFALKAKPHKIGVHITQIMPGTAIFRSAIEEGITTSDVFDRYARGELAKWPLYIPKGLAYEDLAKAQRETYKKFYLRPSYIVGRLLGDLTSWEALKFDFWSGIFILSHGATPGDPSQLELAETDHTQDT